MAFLTCEARGVCFQELVRGAEPGRRVCADRVNGGGLSLSAEEGGHEWGLTWEVEPRHGGEALGPHTPLPTGRSQSFPGNRRCEAGGTE